MKKPPAPLNIGSDLLAALERIGAGSKTTIYGSLICDEADRTGETVANLQTSDPYAAILTSINKLIKSLQRSTLSSEKIQGNITNLPDAAGNFLRLNLMRNLDREIDPDNENWTNPELHEHLLAALKTTRTWFRKTPGPVRAEPLQQFALSVAGIYEQVRQKAPGLGSDDYETGYKTPFEELWLASLRLVLPKATHDQAREIYRAASGRR